MTPVPNIQAVSSTKEQEFPKQQISKKKNLYISQMTVLFLAKLPI